MSVKLSNLTPLPCHVSALAEGWLLAMGREPVLLLEAATGSIVDANPAAAQLLGSKLARLQGASLADLIDPMDIAVLEQARVEARFIGRSGRVAVRRAVDSAPLELTYSLVRSDAAAFWLVHLRDPEAGKDGVRDPSVWPSALKSLEDASEGFMVTNLAFQIEYVNAAFLKLAQLDVPAQALDTLAVQWLHFSAAQLKTLGTQLAERQAVTLLTTALRCKSGLTVSVDVRAVAVPDGDFPCWGFMISPREASQPEDPRRSLRRAVSPRH